MGLDFFRRAIELQRRHCPPGKRIFNALQTNGVLLDDAWCEFFQEHDFLIGISIDGPRELHDAYRLDRGGNPSFDRVMRGLELLKKHRVEYNVLTTLHAANAGHPLEVYQFLREVVGARFWQFIPIVERDGKRVGNRSITAIQYGNFLNTVFDTWVRRDVGRVFVQIFEAALAAWTGGRPGLCIFEETCGTNLAMEHNGDVYSCDHFVTPEHLLGNIRESELLELVMLDRQLEFGLDKRESLPDYCRQCEVRFVCNGGCPKNRFIAAPDGQPGLNYLCRGYRSFFNHIAPAMAFMANELRHRRSPMNVMPWLAARERARTTAAFAGTGRNEPCPCGSGLKFKRCCGRHSGARKTEPTG